MMTFEEYLEFEKSSEIRHEFYQGTLIPMPGEKKRHNRIARNICRILEDAFQPRGCEVYMESVKQEVVPAVYYAYPDVILTCDPADTGDEEAYWVRSPLLLVEVLSDSTAFHDFNFKLAQYQKISSLQYYLLVAQDTCGAHLFSRDSDAAWRHHAFETKDAAVELPVIQFSFQLEDVYKGLKMA